MAAYGNFHDFCRDSTLPVCNLFSEFKIYTDANQQQIGGYGGCHLSGIPLSGERQLQNLGVILLCGIAILVSAALLWRSQVKKAAVGRREMQIFLIGYILMEICEIFTIGGFPLPRAVRIGFTGVHLAIIVSTTWVLMLNGAVGYQVIDDGNILSILLFVLSAGILFIGTGYIALDTGFNWSGYWETTTVQADPNRAYALYTLYLLLPIVFLFIFFVLETALVLTVLRETKPMIWLVSAALLFILGQVFDFVISTHICNGTDGKIDGSLFQTLFTLAAVVTVWVFWDSITESSWPSEDEAPY
ncbi:MAG: hypothetical protein M1831_001745 [Alyxoria varia]|nr:MAG: hypothetical protein M1831_001745 [Alyxoria varia]